MSANPAPSAESVPPRSSVTPFLWFERDARAAAEWYCSLFPDSRVEAADPMLVTFRLSGQRFLAFNGGPQYPLTPAYSMFVRCRDQAEVDRLWAALTADGGEESRCGWLVDRFGLSWQILPSRLMELIGHPDAATRERATRAMLGMQKIDVAALERAATGAAL